MGWVTKFFGVGAAEPIEAVGNVLDELFTSDEEELSLELVRQRLAQRPALIQAEITKVQAQHRSTFVAGARPFLMWVCGLGFLFAFVINPIITWFLPALGTPTLPLEAMMELSLAMLGLASLRTVEKLKGVTK
ncbi:holin family protein [Pseudoalteromonas sp. CNC9-20]|uniref:3TM-type holin n=1 Tax=Pseudoalteromonas sp. CNC9-20 TaxID=2917750 RepID=UPI001EF58827|nr:3TM-type holin [Pseudoalteromonas sp. CNC9-20]MCG7570537.1 holin family protein [Pseudoalteromonas sp. CNC9-20]